MVDKMKKISIFRLKYILLCKKNEKKFYLKKWYFFMYIIKDQKFLGKGNL